MKLKIQTEIIMQASPESVWRVLTDFDNYSAMDIFIKSVEGKVKEGERVVLKMASSSSTVTFRPRILICKENKELRWLGNLLFKGLFDGEHFFILNDNGDGTTTLVHGEHFSGLLVPFLKNMIHTTTLDNFRHMNERLKQLVEQAPV